MLELVTTGQTVVGSMVEAVFTVMIILIVTAVIVMEVIRMVVVAVWG